MMIDGPYGPYDPTGKTQYHVQNVQYVGYTEPLQELLDRGSLYGGWTLVQCFFDATQNSFVVIWRA
jgi:hypothetical protein